MKLEAACLSLLKILGEGATRNLMAACNESILKHGDSPRTLKLDRYERYWRGMQHDAKVAGWDGRKALTDPADVENAHRHGASFGFDYANTSWQARRPSVRKQLCPAIVSRFTGKMFGEGSCPSLQSLDAQGEADGQDWVDALVETSEFWSRCHDSRDSGGGMGSVVMGAQMLPVTKADPAGVQREVGATPLIQVVNAKFCTPTWKGDKKLRVLAAIDIRYRYTVQQELADGSIKDVEYWYWRFVDDQVDVVLTAPVDRQLGDEWRPLGAPIKHGLGFCPFVWIQNEAADSDDGIPDCDEQLDNFDALDALKSDAFKATHRNCAPTPCFFTNEALPSVQMGDETALKFEVGGSAQYMEYTGATATLADAQANALRDSICEDVHVVLEVKPSSSEKTATEVNARSQAMDERVGSMRRSYGPQIVRLFQMLIRASLKVDPTGKKILDRDGNPAFADKDPPKTVTVKLVWPPLVTRSATDVVAEANGIASLVLARLLSRKTGTTLVAPMFDITDIDAELEQIEEERAGDDEDDQEPPELGEDPEPPVPPVPPMKPQPGMNDGDPREDKPAD